ncbi:MAG TPA: ABC transporter ATP-binding protein [Symbiobacteriaceae bacterium]|nr:ABC transporter ATP-binding protein [Symbiobacteriaceae bacterium]
MALLELKNVQTYYGAIHALKGIALSVEQGEVVTLIGSNGAGKSTALKTISGLLKPKEGEILLEGKRIDSLEAHQITAMGIGHVPEGRKIFPRLSVLENLEMGGFTVASKADVAASIERGFALFPRLKERAKQLGGTLSGGEQQMLAIARALMMQPKLLMLDEPSMGLAPILVEQIFEIVKTLNKQGVTILLVEQNALQALEVAHRGYVIQTGEIALADSAANLRENKAVREAYLGEG